MIGNILLTFALLFSIFNVLSYYLAYFKNDNRSLKYGRLSYHLMTIMIILASVLLLHAIITHQYEYRYVYNYSGSGLPFGLLLSTFYAGQEGSFLLWTLFTSLVGLILLEYTAKRGDLEPRVMMFFSFALMFLLIMVNPVLKSPFNYLWMDPTFIDLKNIDESFAASPFLRGFLFTDGSTNTSYLKVSKELAGMLSVQGISLNDVIVQGKGLNPLLQNFWMQIHPPMLFLGFSLSTVPFSFAMAGLIKNDYKNWVKQSIPWTLASTMILGLAIMLGGYWAYGVLGWGGYWGWDPVENSSLIPWLIGVASIHTLLVQRKTQSQDGVGRFGKTNIILSILMFVFVLYSTFLTRSGILGDASVHSFVDPGMTVYLFLVLFMSTFIIIGAVGIGFRWKYLNKYFNYEENILSRELALFTGAISILASAIIVLAGTSAPIFGRTVELKFYNELNLPIAIIIGLLNGISLLLKWKTTKKSDLFKSFKLSFILAIISTLLIVFIGGVDQIMLAVLAFSSSFALIVNAEIAFKIWRKKSTYSGAYISHIGISLFLLGVIATGSYSKESQIQLPKGEKINLYGYDLTFTGYHPIEDGKKFAFNIEINDDDNLSVVSPVMYISEFNNSLMREPDILNLLTKDFYVTPVSFDDDSKSKSSSTSIHLNKDENKTVDDYEIKFVEFNFPKSAMDAMQAGKDFYLGAILEVTYEGKVYKIEPRMQNKNGKRSYLSAQIDEADFMVQLEHLDASGSVDIAVSKISMQAQKNVIKKEVLVVEASIKPFINLVWAGVLIVVFGFILSIIRRTKESVK